MEIISDRERGEKVERKKISILLNGKETEIQADTSLQKLLEELKIKPQLVAVEVNEKIIKRENYASTIISCGDKIEILQMIGGG